ncbi:hypothetical protein [Tenacibaculum bernardetii]|uniref:hypothetical protein n=1 Tax=Tenacibaculum bernardetii TaxID=3021375 RepID=UPI0023B19D78|nr:hypothetical protein [Tenacibaculum bernardetii]
MTKTQKSTSLRKRNERSNLIIQNAKATDCFVPRNDVKGLNRNDENTKHSTSLRGGTNEVISSFRTKKLKIASCLAMTRKIKFEMTEIQNNTSLRGRMTKG